MMTRALAGLMLASPLALAADGSWSSQSFGGTMTRGGQVVKSRPVQSPSPLASGATASRAYWKISTNGPTPVGMRIRLCSAARCLMLPGMAGEIALPTDMSPGGPFRFEYATARGGIFSSPVTVLSNVLTVTYTSPR